MAKLDVKGIFFDFDDTLQSRKGAYRLYCESFLDKYFPDIDEEERLRKLDEMEEHVDGGYKDREVYFPEMIELWGWENHPPLQELYDSFNYDFGKHIVMLDGALDVLKTIKEKGYIPREGDIIFFDWEVDGNVNHVGIVEKVENGKVYTVEGNSTNDTCRQKEYDINSKYIFGYGTPAY